MGYKSKRGSYIMEAAIVLPVMILVVITVVLIMMHFYSSATERCMMHMALRCEAGRMTGKTEYTGEGNTVKDEGEAGVYAKKTLLGSRACGERSVVMEHRGVLEKAGTSVIKGEWSETDGARYIRYCRFVKGMAYE